jgi:hypothetical protein
MAGTGSIAEAPTSGRHRPPEEDGDMSVMVEQPA